jgi:hypothetical protein
MAVVSVLGIILTNGPFTNVANIGGVVVGLIRRGHVKGGVMIETTLMFIS